VPDKMCGCVFIPPQPDRRAQGCRGSGLVGCVAGRPGSSLPLPGTGRGISSTTRANGTVLGRYWIFFRLAR